MKEKLILIDGHSILNRAFYGLPDLTNSEGLHTNAVYGFLNILFKILEEEKGQYLAVAFDLPAPTFRHKLYDQYKGTRKSMPEELREQVPLMKEMLTAMKVPLMMLEGYEADDLIGTVSLQAEEAGLDVCILSGDRDLLQLASETTMVRIPKTKRGGTEVEDYLAADVLERYEVTPSQIIELKALMGDASDNIPGLPGVGEKTATKIIKEYGSIENAYEHVEEITPNKAKNAFLEHFDLAQMSKVLATINRHSPFTLNLEEAKLGSLYTPEAMVLCRKLEFKNLLPRFEQVEEETQKPLKYQIAEDAAQAALILEKASESVRIGLSFLEGKDGKLLAIGICMPSGAGKQLESWMIPAALLSSDAAERSDLQAQPKTGGNPKAAAWEDIEKLSAVRNLLTERTGCVIDLKGCLKYLEGVKRENLFDASIGAYLLNPLKGAYPYEDIAKDHLGLLLRSRTEVFAKADPAALLAGEPQKAAEVVCSEAMTAAASYEPILKGLEEQDMRHLFDEIEMPLVFTLYDMQKEGILVKGEELKTYGENLQERITQLEQEIWSLAGTSFNINSPKQLGQVLAEDMGIKGLKKTKTGYSTAADALEKVADQSPVIGLILEYRQLTKLLSTYAEGLYAFIAQDGRIHGTFNQTITATGRISSTDPNLQNIPVRTELGRQLRKVFVPKEGCVFVDADYSQIELRVLAHASGDEKLIGAYREAQDIHALTASQVFHIPLDQVTAQERRNAKAVNFGIVYGISSFGLSQDLSITRKEAQDYIEKYFRTYPGIKAFLDGCVKDANEKGYAVTLYGRRRPVPELKSSNFMTRSFGERVAMNSPIQGTAADIIKIAMIRVHDRLEREGLKSKLLLQVHDELLVETLAEEQEQVEKILREEMMGAAKLKVELEIDMHAGSSWYEAK